MIKLKPILFRELIIKAIREFFDELGFHEVVIPVFNRAIPTEPNIYPFSTVWSNAKVKEKLYLSTSPEATLKKMIAKGIGNCFGIGSTFRNLEGKGSRHNPEFLMLEWYRANARYEDIMRECEDLILYVCNKVKSQKSKVKITIQNAKLIKTLTYLGKLIELKTPWKRISMIELFWKYAGLDLLEIIDDKKMETIAKKRGYKTERAGWEELYNQIFLNEIEPELGMEPFFLTDFPSRISPLCKPKKDNGALAERFELYIAGMELGNGNTENTDEKAVKKIFLEEEKLRKRKNIEVSPLDTGFLRSLRFMQGKSWAGIGLGVDRLAMLMSNTADINNLKY